MFSDTLELLRPPQRERLSDQIARQIKKLIFNEKIEVGQKLPPERELAEFLGVSRVVVREALRNLELTGFVEIKTGHTGGSFVSNKIYKPILDSIYDLLRDGDITLLHFFEARSAIETFSIQLAVENLRDGDIEQLEAINQKLQEDMKDNRRFHYNNLNFHVKISEISRNPLVKLLVNALLNTLIMIYPQPSQSADFIKRVHEAHVAIINAMRQKDLHACERLIKEDVGLTKVLLDEL